MLKVHSRYKSSWSTEYGVSISWYDIQLAVHITDEEEEGMLDDLSLLDSVDFNAAPFDEWRMDENRELEELLRLPAYDLFTDAEREKEQQATEQRVVSDRVRSYVRPRPAVTSTTDALRFGIDFRYYGLRVKFNQYYRARVCEKFLKRCHSEE